MRFRLLLIFPFTFSAQAAPIFSAPTDTVKGRAPTAEEVLIDNETAPGEAPWLGSKLKGSYTYGDADGDEQQGTRFQWLREGVNIDGATSESYTVQGADQGKKLTFQVTPASVPTADPDQGVLTVSDSVLVQSPPTATDVQVAGERMVGQTLTASYQYNDADGDEEGASVYEWYRGCNGMSLCEKIPGANGLTYALQRDDEDKYVSFSVLPKSLTGTPSIGVEVKSAFGDKVAPKPGSAPVASNVQVSGSYVVGQTLTASYTYSDADGDEQGATTLRWYRGCNGMSFCTEIPGATGSTYKLQEADAGAYVKVMVTPVAKTGTPKQGSEAASTPTTKVLGVGSFQVLGIGQYSQAQSMCDAKNLRLPTKNELQTTFYTFTSGGTNYEMCSRYGWPLRGQCGGIADEYWTNESLTNDGYYVDMTVGYIYLASKNASLNVACVAK